LPNWSDQFCQQPLLKDVLILLYLIGSKAGEVDFSKSANFAGTGGTKEKGGQIHFTIYRP